VLAPLGVNVNNCPIHIAPLFTVIVGLALTVIDDIAVLELTQPLVPVPVTLMLVLVKGESVELPLE
jgi:hypothetical protein